MRVERVESESSYQEALGIRKAVFVAEQGVPLALEVDVVTPAMCTFLVRNADGMAVSTGRTTTVGPLLKFQRIATLAPWRGRGFGRVLMLAMQDDANVRLPDSLPYMHAQTSAIAFYERLGWVKVGAPFFEADMEHAAMARKPTSLQRAALLAYKDLPLILREALERGEL